MSAYRVLAVLLTLGIGGVLSAIPRGAAAAGFAISEQSVKGLGTAYAGAAAAAEDGSTIYYNPAGMSRLTGTQVVFGGQVIMPSTHFSNSGSNLGGALSAFPLTGNDGGDGGVTAFVPNIYVTHSLGSRVTIGLGVEAPFGLVTDYNDGWIGRYHAMRSDLRTVNLNPSISFKFNRYVSVGVGVSAMHTHVNLTNALDFSSLCLGLQQQGKLAAGTCGALGLGSPANPATDGFSKLEGDSWGFGYDVGILLQPRPDTRVGISYRSRVLQNLKGTAYFQVPAAAAPLAAATQAFSQTGSSSSLDLPDSLSVSALHQLTPAWAVMADITWTNWSRFQQLVVRFDNPAQPPNVTPEHWRDTMRYALGVRWSPVDKPYTLRTGIAWDQTPVPSAALRTPRIPDQNRFWLAFGGSYRLSKALSVDASYAHLFVNDTGINNAEINTGHVLNGQFSSDVDIVGVQLVWRMR